MRVVLPAALILMIVILGILEASGASTSTQGPFRFEVEQTRSRRGNLAVEGYVYNSLLWPVGRVRLRIDILDQNTMVIDTTYGWVGRDVPAGGRAYFVVPIAVEGAAYRVTVASFDTLGGGGA